MQQNYYKLIAVDIHQKELEADLKAMQQKNTDGHIDGLQSMFVLTI